MSNRSLQLQRRSAAISTLTATSLERLWSRVDPENLVGSWDSRAATEILTEGKRAAVTSALGYVEDVLAEEHTPMVRTATLSESAFTMRTVDGRTVQGLVEHTPYVALQQVKSGVSLAESLAAASTWLLSAALTELADTKRSVIAADAGLSPTITGYTRVLTPPSCSRCMILAGKRFKWNDGFQRHPRCDCAHVPTAIVAASGPLVDPYAAFNELSRAEQNRLYGEAGAEAIRNGADIYRVENVRLRGLSTPKRAARTGAPSRFTVDELLAETKGLDERAARELFRRRLAEEGYVTGAQVAGGNIVGNRLVPFTGQSARAAAERAAFASGRDPLNRYTMTSAERSLFDNTYKLRYYEQYGVVPRTVGANSADRGVTYRTPTQVEVDAMRATVDRLSNNALQRPGSSLHRLQVQLDETSIFELEQRIRAAQTATVRAASALGR